LGNKKRVHCKYTLASSHEKKTSKNILVKKSFYLIHTVTEQEFVRKVLLFESTTHGNRQSKISVALEQ